MLEPALDRARLARDGDAQDLFGLLSLCFAAYRGCLVDPHDDLADLRRPGQSFRGPGATFLVVEDEGGRVCACVAVDRPAPDAAEMHRLYARLGYRALGVTRDLGDVSHSREARFERDL